MTVKAVEFLTFFWNMKEYYSIHTLWKCLVFLSLHIPTLVRKILIHLKSIAMKPNISIDDRGFYKSSFGFWIKEEKRELIVTGHPWQLAWVSTLCIVGIGCMSVLNCGPWSLTSRWHRFRAEQPQCQSGARRATVRHLGQRNHWCEENKSAALRQGRQIWPQQVSCSDSIHTNNPFNFHRRMVFFRFKILLGLIHKGVLFFFIAART